MYSQPITRNEQSGWRAVADRPQEAASVFHFGARDATVTTTSLAEAVGFDSEARIGGSRDRLRKFGIGALTCPFGQ